LVAVALSVVAGCGSPATDTEPDLSTPPATSTSPSSLEQPWWQRPTAAPADSAPIREMFSLSGDVLFEPDQPDLTPAASSQLAAILAVVQAHPGARLLIEGHADHGQGGTTAQPLSEQRATNVGAWFVAHGVPDDRVQTVGYGDTRPKMPSDTAEHRAQNRRCDITVTSG
jgi:outer membrane protein OmpA-like peptidoglycan-associated protein